MNGMLDLVHKRYRNESKIWNFDTQSRITSGDFANFGLKRAPTVKIPATGEISWRPDLQLLSGQYVISRVLHGVAANNQRIPTADFDVVRFETVLDGNRVREKSFSLGRMAGIGSEAEIVAVPFPGDKALADFVLGHADMFMCAKVSSIEAAPQIASGELIG